MLLIGWRPGPVLLTGWRPGQLDLCLRPGHPCLRRGYHCHCGFLVAARAGQSEPAHQHLHEAGPGRQPCAVPSRGSAEISPSVQST